MLIRACEGPERIETGWWSGEAARRDYYRVETETGARYWIFRDLAASTWFLHGLFT
jgi:protein ImuB